MDDFIELHAKQSKEIAERATEQSLELNKALRDLEKKIVDANALNELDKAKNPILPIEERLLAAFEAGETKGTKYGEIEETARIEVELAQNLLAARAQLDLYMNELGIAVKTRDKKRIDLAKRAATEATEIVNTALKEYETYQTEQKLKAEIQKKADEAAAFKKQAEEAAAAANTEHAHE
jgi:hypothetical protein